MITTGMQFPLIYSHTQTLTQSGFHSLIFLTTLFSCMLDIFHHYINRRDIPFDPKGYGMALAKLFKVYCQCSSRIVIAAAATTTTQSSSSSAAASSSLVDRRKHIIRVMLVGLNLITTVDNAYYRHLRDYYQNTTVSSATATTITPTLSARKAATYGSLLLALNGCLYARQGLVRALCSGTKPEPR